MSRGLIRADADTALDRLTRSLTAKAALLATARIRSRLLARRNDDSRWRRANLVWPLFASGRHTKG